MSWRPPNFKNPYNPKNSVLERRLSEVYEAGAEAILEALRERGLYNPDDFVVSARVKKDDPDWAEPFFESITEKGWLVYIPEEEK